MFDLAAFRKTNTIEARLLVERIQHLTLVLKPEQSKMDAQPRARFKFFNDKEG